MEHTINERLAVLETKLSNIEEDQEHYGHMQTAMMTKLDTLTTSITKYELAVTRYKGFLGGVVFILSCLSVFIAKFGAMVWATIKTIK